MRSNRAANYFLVIASQAYSVIVLALFLSAADLHLGRKQILGMKPTVAAVVLLLPFFMLALIIDLMRHKRGTETYQALRANIAPIACFGLMASISLIWSAHPTAYWGEKAKYIFLDLYGFIIMLCAMSLPMFRFFRANYRAFVTAGLLCLLGSIYYELYHPGLFSPVPSRAGGFPGNPNFSALILNMLCAAALGYSPGKDSRRDLVLLGLSSFGVFSTQSRSGLTCFAVLMLYYTWFTYIRSGVAIKKLFNLAFAIVFLLTFFWLGFPMLAENTAMFSKYKTRFDRYESGSRIDDGSSDRRMRAFRDGVKLIEESPVFGHGSGFTRTMDAKPHNLYVQQWVNGGILALAAYLGFVISAGIVFLRRNFGPGLGLILMTAMGSFFSHNIIEQRTFLILLGSFLTISSLRMRDRKRELRAGRPFVAEDEDLSFTTPEPSPAG